MPPEIGMELQVEGEFGPVFEETLALTGDGTSVVHVVRDGGRNHIYEYRRCGQVVAEATTLRVLSELIEQVEQARSA